MDLKIPDEFVLKANSETSIGTLDLSMSASLLLKKIYLSVSVNAFSDRKALEFILDGTKNLLILHTIANSCTKIGLNSQISSILEDSNSYSNLAIMFLDRNHKDGYIQIDTKQIFDASSVPGDLIISYDEQGNIKKIRVELGEDRSVEFDVSEIKRTKLKDSDFTVPKSWRCDKEKVKNFDEIRTEDFIGDGLLDLQDLINNFGSFDASKLGEEFKKIISNNSP
jgi:uncharacterized protein YuzE